MASKLRTPLTCGAHSINRTIRASKDARPDLTILDVQSRRAGLLEKLWRDLKSPGRFLPSHRSNHKCEALFGDSVIIFGCKNTRLEFMTSGSADPEV